MPLVIRFLNHAGPVSHSLLLSCSTLVALVPMSAGLSIPFTWFFFETSVLSKISANRFATNTCCLRRELCISCRAIVESVECLQFLIKKHQRRPGVPFLAVLNYILPLLVSATFGSWSFHFKNSSSLGSTELSQCCPFFVQILFRSRLIRTLNGANNPRESNTDETRDKIIPGVIGVSTDWCLTSLLVPQQQSIEVQARTNPPN